MKITTEASIEPERTSHEQGLMATGLRKLSIGSVQPTGWLGHQLDLMAKGMVGRLPEISDFLRDENGWFERNEYGWEEQPYWLRGYYRLAILTKDERMLTIARRWIDRVLESQDDDGYFGPHGLKSVTLADGRQLVDLWAHMVMIEALIVHHEYAADRRVVPFLERFFRFCEGIPEDQFVPSPQLESDPGKDAPSGKRYIDVINEQLGKGSSRWFVQWPRSGEMIPHIYWLYGHTGASWLLDLARRFYEHVMPPLSEWLHDHVVNFTQRFRYPASYYLQTGDAWHLEQTEYWYRQHMTTWGQQPRGAFAADERIRPGYVDPRQAIETCAITEFAKSFTTLGRISGDTSYADRCEDIMLNHFPAAQMADHTGVRYLTASNMPVSDASFNHDYYNDRHYARALTTSQVVYSASSHRCCQHNHGQGWPGYAENLWQGSHDGGLVAWMYAACRVSTTVGSGDVPVSIIEETSYPFSDRVVLRIESSAAVSFPLYLRVPGWCDGAEIRLNGQGVDVAPAAGSFVRIEREWRSGDRLELALPMQVTVHRWPRNGSLTLDRGPLSYSVRIEEQWRRCGGSEEWPDWEVLPLSPWNYGLMVSADDREPEVEILFRDADVSQPWTVSAAPVELLVRAKRLPGWSLESGMVPELPDGPVRSCEPAQKITMIPLGCARLRMSCLPRVSEEPHARIWPSSPPDPPS